MDSVLLRIMPPNFCQKCKAVGLGKPSRKNCISILHTFRIRQLIFKRTGSITKLQKAMGHSSINVSLTYLRGLEVPELTENDMPVID